MEKLVEHSYSSHIYMRILLDGREEEISCYAGRNGAWNTYRTSGDNDPGRREKIIRAFNELY